MCWELGDSSSLIETLETERRLVCRWEKEGKDWQNGVGRDFVIMCEEMLGAIFLGR